MSEGSRILADLLADAAVRPLVDAIRTFDAGTHRHSLRVARFAIALGRADGMTVQQVRELAVAALLHDLGKTKLDGDVIRKPGPLDAAERAHVRRHPASATPELEALAAFPNAHRIVPLHHELEEEDSYPRSGHERRDAARAEEPDRRRAITPDLVRAGRILALADRYDALISHRPYKEPVPQTEVRERLQREMPDLAGLIAHLPAPKRPPR